MSTIDEIMKQADDYARSWADAQTSEISHRGTADVCCDADQSALRDLIAVALEDARREGAEAMREAVATWHAASGFWVHSAHMPATIRALPLPTGERQAVMLTDEQIMSAGRPAYDGLMDHVYEHGTAAEGGRHHALKMMRAIEAASLAANNLEARRG